MIVDRLLELSVDHRREVPLQVAADLVVRIAKTVRSGVAGRIEQEAGGLDGTRAEHHRPARTVRLRCSAPEPAVKVTPVTAPRWPVSTRDTIADVTSVQRPVARARAMTVFWVPFLASTGQAKPTQ